MASAPRTMFDKIWERHAITVNEAGQTLLFIDRHFCHELSFHVYNMLLGRIMSVPRPVQTFAMPDLTGSSGSSGPPCCSA